MPKPKDVSAFWITFAVVVLVAVVAGAGVLHGWLINSTAGIFVLAALVAAFLLLFVEAVAHWAGMSFLASVILGFDGRTSTSKTFVLMWSLLVSWGIFALLIAGEFLPTETCVSADHTCAKDAIGFLQLGWQSFVKSGLNGAYLVLLGIPAAAAVAAKAITQNKVDSGATPVVPMKDSDRTVSARVMQVFSADDGSTDIGDFQYAVFNLVLASYFVVGLVNLSSLGLPQLPDTLLGLTSVSAALYVGKKAAASTQPTITAVFPSVLRADAQITIIGNDLTDDPVADPALAAKRMKPEVRINGVEVPNVTLDPSQADRLTAVVPADLNPGKDPISGSLEVLSSYGFKTPAFTVTISPA